MRWGKERASAGPNAADAYFLLSFSIKKKNIFRSPNRSRDFRHSLYFTSRGSGPSGRPRQRPLEARAAARPARLNLPLAPNPPPDGRNHFSQLPGGTPAAWRQSGPPFSPRSALQKTTEALQKIGKRKFPMSHVVSLLRRDRSASSAPQFSLQVALNGSCQDETGRVRRHFVCVRGERGPVRETGGG